LESVLTEVFFKRLELAAANEAAMKALVTTANKFAGQRLPFHGRGGKIDRMLNRSDAPKPRKSNENSGASHKWGWGYPEDWDEELRFMHEYDQEWMQELDDMEEQEQEQDNLGLFSTRRSADYSFCFCATATISNSLVGRIIGKGGSRIQELRSLEGMVNVDLTEKSLAHELKLAAATEQALCLGIDMVQEFGGAPVSFKTTKPASPPASAVSFSRTLGDFPLPGEK